MKENTRLIAKKSGINGKGCFAAVPLRARAKVGELLGERIRNREAARRVANGGKVRICELDEVWSIDASRGGDATASSITPANRIASAA